MTRVRRTVHLPNEWSVSIYENGAVQVQEKGKDSVPLPPEVVEAIVGLHE